MPWYNVCCGGASVEEEQTLRDSGQESPGCVWRGRKVECKPIDWCMFAGGLCLEVLSVVLITFANTEMPAGMPQPPPFVGYFGGAVACVIGVGVIAYSTLSVSKVDDENNLL